MSYRPDATIQLLVDSRAQGLLGSRAFTYFFPNVSTTIGQQGHGAANNVGSVTHPDPSAGSFMSQSPRAIHTSGTAVNSVAGFQCTKLAFCIDNGFRFTAVLGTTTTTTSQRTFWGLQDSNTTSATSSFNLGTTEPSSRTNVIGVGYDHAETNLYVMHNDAAGACTRIDLGVNFPVDAVSLYLIEFWCAPGASEVFYKVTRRNDGTTVEGSITTDLPASTVLMGPQCQTSNGGTGGVAAAQAMQVLYVQTPA